MKKKKWPLHWFTDTITLLLFLLNLASDINKFKEKYAFARPLCKSSSRLKENNSKNSGGKTSNMKNNRIFISFKAFRIGILWTFKFSNTFYQNLVNKKLFSNIFRYNTTHVTERWNWAELQSLTVIYNILPLSIYTNIHLKHYFLIIISSSLFVIFK